MTAPFADTSPQSRDAAHQADALARLKHVLGPQGWSADPHDLAPKLRDWRGRYQGATPLLARPASTQETAAIVHICAEAGLAITPQGGNTGLVGGSTPQGEILLSLERMRAITVVDAADNSLTAQAGVTLSEIQNAAAQAERLFPLSLASEGSATLGGLLATNAGGVAVLRYGMMRDLTLGLEAVLPDGRVWNGLRSLRKDNMGYDLKHVMIGAEGTLGIITAATVKLFPRPRAHATALCALESPAAAVALLRRLQDALGDALTAFELMPAIGLELVARHIPDAPAPFSPKDHPWFVLAEASFNAAAEAAQEDFATVLAAEIGAGRVRDGLLAASEAQRASFWTIRETLPEAEKKHGRAIKHDVATPVSAMPRFMEAAGAAAQRLLPGSQIIAFGHVGDGNLHFNVSPPVGVDPWAGGVADKVSEAIHAIAMEMGGSLAAEHGVGVLKRDALAAQRSPVEMDMMRAVKAALDPQRIMNPRVMV